MQISPDDAVVSFAQVHRIGNNYIPHFLHIDELACKSNRSQDFVLSYCSAVD